MTGTSPFSAARAAIRNTYVADETTLAGELLAIADIGQEARGRARKNAAEFVAAARANAMRSGLIDKFLQEYGLSTAEGVTLMRLAEALLRTPDAATADALIADKVEAGDWAAHKGKSLFPVVNFSTRALMLAAAWLDEFEAKDPAQKIARATKAVLDRVGEPVIRAAVAQAMRVMGEHFVLGQTIEAALQRARRFAEQGYLFSFDMLGEAAHTEEDARRYYNEYADAIAAIADGAKAPRAIDNHGISVKLSALHPRYEFIKKERVLNELGARVRDLALMARAANISFNIDAEEAERLDISLDLFEALMRDPAFKDWDGLGVVVQSYLRRGHAVIDWLAALARETGRRVMVRLVKGAYWDAEIKRAQVLGLESYPVFTRKALTDVSFTACARKLLENAEVFYPQFATHNALTAAMVQEMAGDAGDYEFQRLHGMGEALHDSLIRQGARSRIYAPVGGHRELLPYLVRRLLENGANSSFVNQLIDPDLSVDDVVADPVEEARALDVFPNPAIPAPRDLFNGERLLAKGWDWTHPPTAEAMTPQARKTLSPIAARALVGGEPQDGVISPVVNPADHKDAVGSIEPAAPEMVARACAQANEAAPRWAATPASQRAAILRRAADLLEERADHFMALAVFEAGKTWPDAVAEVREAVDFCRYYAARAEDLGARKALGVVACISPWNFPLAIFIGQVAGALAAGNAVVAKPAGPTPLIAYEAVRLLHEAGVPGDALHYLPGSGRTVGGPVTEHSAVKGVIFTGSTDTARSIKRAMVESGKPDATLIAETGGINAMIIDSTALMEQAVTDVIVSAFQSAGQRCSACRLVCVQEDAADRFLTMLAGAMAELKTGDPSELSTDVGPVIDEGSKRTIESHIEEMEQSARMIARAPEPTTAGGTFVRPAAFEIERIEDLRIEVFGPVLHVARYGADDLDAVIDAINAKGFGLTLGAHTRIDEAMHRIAARARVGNIYVNRNQIGAVVGVQPFGGENLSGTGPKAGGPHYIRGMTRRPGPAGLRGAEEASAALAGEGGFFIAARPLTVAEEAGLRAADAAAPDWSASAVRGEILNSAGFDEESKLYDAFFAESLVLPGPTGESNTLRLRGRGVVLCLGGGDGADPALAEKQAARALAAGNTVIVDEAAAAPLAERLKSGGAPDGLVVGVTLQGGAPEALLLDARIAAVVFDGGAEGRAALETALLGRTGAIIPVLTLVDEPWRYAVERTLTVNTTAAGGDVRLLSLPD
ncbi:MAG: bifunctional proline dehydrogenase/L-glutamate gamma-semialdehyde dehydrogenase PutA [Parvularculaceae bacterium]